MSSSGGRLWPWPRVSWGSKLGLEGGRQVFVRFTEGCDMPMAEIKPCSDEFGTLEVVFLIE